MLRKPADIKVKSVEFSWDSREFASLLRSCQFDDSVNLTLKYLHDREIQILEAGCGSGRVVKYLYDLGYKNVYGIELNGDAVLHINETFPELKIIQGDILGMPYERGTFDVVLSYGVVEHFPESVLMPLQSIYNVLKPGGIAIITVPSLNIIRKWITRLYLDLLNPRTFVRAVKRISQPSIGKLYHSYPPYGDFFEYRLTPEEFISVCKKAGFQILESAPIAHIDGLFHLFGPPLVKYKNWEFTVSTIGRTINKILMRYPFLHNHMHACVLRKNG